MMLSLTMVADFFTKPLQGSLFKKLRDQVMNVDPGADSLQDRRSVLENRGDVHTTDGEWTVVHKQWRRQRGKVIGWKE